MKHLSLLTIFLLTSSMVHADWIRHDFNPDTKMYNPDPKYSCLEMICEGGCSENTETGEGICCPEPSIESCTSEQFDEYNCPLCKVVLPCPENASIEITKQQIGSSACYCKEGYFATQEGYCSICPDEFSQEMTKTANYKKRYLEYTWTNPYQCDYDLYFNSGSHITVEKDCKGSKDGGDERLTLLIGDTYVYNNSKTICPRYDGEKVGTVYHNTNNTIYIQGKNPGGHKGFSINATFKRKK